MPAAPSTGPRVDRAAPGPDLLAPVNETLDLINGSLFSGPSNPWPSCFGPWVPSAAPSLNEVLVSCNSYPRPGGVIPPSDPGNSNVVLVNATSGRLDRSYNVGPGPFASVYDPQNGKIYASKWYAGNISIISARTGATLANLPGTRPEAMALDSGTGNLYVCDLTGNDVIVVSGSTDAILTTIPISSPYGIAYDPVTSDVYVAAGSHSLAFIQDSTNTVVRTVTTGAWPWAIAVDQSLGELFVANEGSNNVSVVSATNGAPVATVAVGSSPEGIAFDPVTANVFVANDVSNNVSVVSASTNRVIRTLPSGYGPEGVTYDAGNGDVYLANERSDNLTVISGVTDTIVRSIGVGTFPMGLANDTGNGEVYAVNYATSNVSAVDGATHGVATSIPLDGTGQYIAFDPRDGRLFVPCAGPGNVEVIADSTNTVVRAVGVGVANPVAVGFDPALDDAVVANDNALNLTLVSGLSGSTVASWGTGSYDNGMTYDPVQRELYVADYGTNNISVYDGVTGSAVASISYFGISPFDVVYDPADRNVYASVWGGGGLGTVSVINTTTNAVTKTIPIGREPMDLAYDSDNREVFVSEFGDNQVAILAGGSLLGTIPVGLGPWGTTYDPSTREVYVANYYSSTLSILDGSLQPPSLSGVSVSPSSASLSVGTSGSFVASASCSGGPCPSGTSYAWSLTHPLGTLNTSTGPNVRFTAGGAAGRTVLFANASFNGVTAQSAPVPITITNSPPRHYNVSFVVHPTSCPITFNATSQTSGSSGQFLAGTYTANAPWCGPDWSFLQWNSSGGVSVSSPTALSPTVSISANGSLTAYYAWAGPVPVTFHVSPPRCGTISINGSTQADGSTANLLLGGYSIGVNPCSYYVFHQWNATGGVSVLSPGAASTSLTLTTSGSLTAWFLWTGSGRPTPRFHVTFFDSPSGCPLTFNASSQLNGTSATLAEGNYSAFAPPCNGYVFNDWLSRLLPPGGGVINSGSVVNPDLVDIVGNGTLNVTYWRAPPPPTYSVTFDANPTSCGPVLFNGTLQADGSSVIFAAGTYLAHAGACAGWIFSEWDFSPATLGTVQYYYTPWANVSVSSSGTLTAFYSPPPLLASLSANPTTLTAGGGSTLTPTLTGGVSPYACRWSLNGTNTTQTGCGAAGLTFPHPGTYTYRVWATDASSQVAGSNSVAITVGAPPAPPQLVAFANATLVSDHVNCAGLPDIWNVSLTASARGGSPPYTYSWDPGDGSMPLVGVTVVHSYIGTGPTWTAVLSVEDSSGRITTTNVQVAVPVPGCPAPRPTPAPGLSLLGLSTAASLLLVAALVAVAVLVPLVLLWSRRSGREPPPPPAPATAAPLEERPPSW